MTEGMQAVNSSAARIRTCVRACQHAHCRSCEHCKAHPFRRRWLHDQGLACQAAGRGAAGDLTPLLPRLQTCMDTNHPGQALWKLKAWTQVTFIQSVRYLRAGPAESLDSSSWSGTSRRACSAARMSSWLGWQGEWSYKAATLLGGVFQLHSTVVMVANMFLG
jgi:hypothetical protein